MVAGIPLTANDSLQAVGFFFILLKENFQLTVAVRLMPPLSFFLKPILGGLLLRRIPNPSSSFSMIFLWPRGFSTSRTIRMRLQVRATKNQKDKVISQNSTLTQSEGKHHKIWLRGLMTVSNPGRPVHCLFLNSSVRLKFVMLAKHHWQILTCYKNHRGWKNLPSCWHSAPTLMTTI